LKTCARKKNALICAKVFAINQRIAVEILVVDMSMNKSVYLVLSLAAIFKKIRLINKIDLKPKKMIGVQFVFAIN